MSERLAEAAGPPGGHGSSSSANAAPRLAHKDKDAGGACTRGDTPTFLGPRSPSPRRRGSGARSGACACVGKAYSRHGFPAAPGARAGRAGRPVAPRGPPRAVRTSAYWAPRLGAAGIICGRPGINDVTLLPTFRGRDAVLNGCRGRAPNVRSRPGREPGAEAPRTRLFRAGTDRSAPQTRGPPLRAPARRSIGRFPGIPVPPLPRPLIRTHRSRVNPCLNVPATP